MLLIMMIYATDVEESGDSDDGDDDAMTLVVIDCGWLLI